MPNAPAAVAVEASRFLTPDQFARRFAISRALVYKKLAAGEVRSVKINNCRRISVDEANRFEQSLTGGTVANS